MYDYNLDIVGGAYSTKEDNNAVFAIRTFDDGDYKFGKDGEVFPVRYVSSGCMAIKRKVLEEMIKQNTVHYCHPRSFKFYPFFLPMQYRLNNEWLYLSEDWAFCQRALDLGFKIWCDGTTRLDHIGDYTYNWDSMVREPRKTAESLNYMVRAEIQ